MCNIFWYASVFPVCPSLLSYCLLWNEDFHNTLQSFILPLHLQNENFTCFCSLSPIPSDTVCYRMRTFTLLTFPILALPSSSLIATGWEAYLVVWVHVCPHHAWNTLIVFAVLGESFDQLFSFCFYFSNQNFLYIKFIRWSIFLFLITHPSLCFPSLTFYLFSH